MHIQLFHRFSRFILLFVFSLGMVACSSGGSSSGSTNSNTNTNTTSTNTAPVASDANLSLSPGTTVTGTLVARDAEGDPLTYSVVSGPSDGTLTLNDISTGAYTYVNAGTQNSDSFTFKANDGKLDSNIATVSVTTVLAAAPASGLTATAGDRSNKLNWDLVSGADSYNVYRSPTPGAGTTGTKIASGVKPPYYDNGLTNGTAYYYVVTAVNNLGESTASAQVYATPADILISSLSFPDTNLQSCVDGTVGVTYVHDLTYLYCYNSGIADLSGIAALTSMTELNLDKNNISDLSPLTNLTALTQLILTANSISDLGPLANLTGLTYLSVDINSISDLSPLASLVNLTDLSLFTNSISDLSPLASLTKLTSLNLNDNSISDISSLSGLTNLTWLGLQYNSISDLSALSSLNRLASLNLNYNSISDLSPLATLTSLTNLDLDFNNISDVSPLANLTSLTALGVSNNNIGNGVDGHVDMLSSLTSATAIQLSNNINMSCSELSALITAVGWLTVTPNTAAAGTNCTNP